MKRVSIMLLMLSGVMSLWSQGEDPTFKLYIKKVELSGIVQLVWTKPASMNGTIQFKLYRAKVADSSAFDLIATTSDTLFTDSIPTVITNLSNTYAYYVLATSGVVTVKSNVPLIPVPGVPFIGSFKLEGKIEGGKVKLQWEAPPINTPIEYYLVYRGLANGIVAPSPENSVMIDSTMNLFSESDTTGLHEGLTYAFFVRGKLLSSNFLTSTYVGITIKKRDRRDEVNFVSVPPQFGQINKKYEYTAKAISKDSTAVIYYSGIIQQTSNIAPGAPRPINVLTIDSVTGVVDWTPTVKGWYYIAILARSNKGGTAKQSFNVGITGGNGIIQGKVTDTLNVGISNVVIEVFKTENTTELSFAYAERTDANGNYRISRVDPGSYKLRANSPSPKYQSQWYNGVRLADSADIIAVSDSPAVTIANFKLRGGAANLPKIAVIGTVTDTLGFAINGANCRVVFVRAEFALNIGIGVNSLTENFRKLFAYNARGDFRLEGNSEFVFKVHPDSVGKYHLELPPGRYIAFARAKGYATEFYNEAPDLLSAEVILVPTMRVPPMADSYNFTLAPLPAVVLGEISGVVMDSVKNIPVPSRVIAFRDRWNFAEKHRIARAYVTDTDSLGMYSFDELLPGIYVVLAVPLGEYAPVFYSENDFTSARWKHATKIAVNGNSIDNINIYVKSFEPSANGFAGINGRVTMIRGNGSGEGSHDAGGVVYAMLGNEVAGYAFTNAAGDYEIAGLAPGTYSVFADKLGFTESELIEANIGYDNSGAAIIGNADFVISDVNIAVTEISTGPSVPTEYILSQNYPNPFNPSTTISYSLPNAGYILLKVYDILGKEVVTLVNGYQSSGRYNVTLNASRLSSGIYFYRLDAGSYKSVKKMLLIK